MERQTDINLFSSFQKHQLCVIYLNSFIMVVTKIINTFGFRLSYIFEVSLENIGAKELTNTHNHLLGQDTFNKFPKIYCHLGNTQ